MKFWTSACFTLAIIASTTTHAALIQNGTYITDTETSLDWFTLTATSGYSYNQMLYNFTDINSQFYGFTYATRTELQSLWQNAGYTGNFYDYTYDSANQNAITELYTLFGQTGTNCCNRSDGMYDDGNSANEQVGRAFLIPEYIFNLSPYYYDDPDKSLARLLDDALSPYIANDSNDLYHQNEIGSWIYRESSYSPVPVPAAVWLFSSGLLALAGLTGHRRNRFSAN